MDVDQRWRANPCESILVIASPPNSLIVSLSLSCCCYRVCRPCSSSEDDNHTPEPEQYIRDYDQEDSEERSTPAPAYAAYDSAGWSDPAAGWADEPAAWTAPADASVSAANTTSVQVASEQLPKVSPIPSSAEFEDRQATLSESEDWSRGANATETAGYVDTGDVAEPVDGMQLVGKLCRAVYAYQAQNTDELEVAEEEQLSVVSAADPDWVTAQNVQGVYS